MEHTPGPWEVRKHVSGAMADIYSPDHCDCLATTAFHGWTFEEMEAHARRIVACVNGCQGINPEAVKLLLATCEMAIEALDRLGADAGELDVLDAAIAKAKSA